MPNESPEQSQRPVLLRRVVLFGVPALYVCLGLLHPTENPGLGDPTAWFIGLHVAQLFLIAGLGYALWLLLEDRRDGAARLARTLVLPFVVLYTALDAILGMAWGVAAQKANELPAADQAGAGVLVDSLTEATPLGYVLYFGAGMVWLAVALAVVAALSREAPWPVIVLMGLGSAIFALGHAPPTGPIGMGMFLAGVVWWELGKPRLASAAPESVHAHPAAPAHSSAAHPVEHAPSLLGASQAEQPASRLGPGEWVLVLTPPLALAALELFHPQPEQSVSALLDVATWFTVFHVVQLALIGLVGLSVLLLARVVGGVHTWSLRLGLGLFLVFFSAYDTLAGIGTGLAMRSARGLSAAEAQSVFDVVEDWPGMSPVFALSILGTGGWVLSVGAVALAARRRQLPRATWVLLLLAAVLLMGGHPFPAGTLAFGCLFAAALLLLRNDTNRQRAPMDAGLDLQPVPQVIEDMGRGLPVAPQVMGQQGSSGTNERGAADGRHGAETPGGVT